MEEKQLIEVIGFVAGTCTTVSLIPQVRSIWKTKETKGISLLTFIIFLAGIGFWITFGVLTSSPSVIITNSITAVLVLMIIYFKIKYK